ncbi:helix-hairpin-helix domain-containing protein [Massilia sp. SR12]
MSKALYTSAGEAIHLGRELGKGGEGAVFDVTSDQPIVAKIYHKTPDQRKQQKLEFMARAGSPKLQKYVAWPVVTLRETKSGPVIGYLMPKVSKRAPIQMIYSPAHRRQDHPKAAWDFLLCVARNVAAAFDVIHDAGHVLGDVNQGNVMVAGDSTVTLIDSDSFQINANGTLHLCEVGVSHFTPPELQGASTFAGVTRTTNHDNFGLALLIFHVLFGGRHPYSGVPLRQGVGDALETDIEGFRYAYAKDAGTRGISPPPRSIPAAMLPDVIERMFHVAFTESGAKSNRPTAKQWVQALDHLRGELRRCSVSKLHVFPGHLSACAWCALEQQGVIYFVDLDSAHVHGEHGFDVARLWAAIETIQPPGQARIPVIDASKMRAKALPPGAVQHDTGKAAIRFGAIILAVLLFIASPSLVLLWLLLAWAGWSLGKPTENKVLTAERLQRKQNRDQVKREYELLVQQLRKATGPEAFLAKKAELAKLRAEYRALAESERQELTRLHSTAQERQKKHFLEKHFIDSAAIPGVGPARKAALRSFGIETAADINKRDVMQVKGFGEGLTRALLDWRASCERRFTFNPAMAVTNADKNAVRAKYGALAVRLEKSLTAGLSELRALGPSMATTAATLQPRLEEAARRLAQADLDLMATQ